MKPGDASDQDWDAYYAKTGQRPPRATLCFALDKCAAEPPADGDLLAVDLGCGNGRDTVEILRRGWSVVAIDAEPDALQRLTTRPDLPAAAALTTQLGRFEDLQWPAAHLVNASFSLPLCPGERFNVLWQRIVDSLLPGGRFSGQLYGDRDEWAGDPELTHLSRAEVDTLLADLTVEYFEEEEDDSVTPRGKLKHWHIFHIVARKG